MRAVLLTSSTGLLLLGPATYMVSIARGVSKPHRMTRFILFFVLGLNFVSILAAGGNAGARLFAGLTFAQATVILLMSLWRGMGGWNVLDRVCLGVAALGILGWRVTGDPLVGIWFSVLADFSAYLPAFAKTWKRPDTESPWYYVCGALSALLGLAAYRPDSSSIFQVYILTASLAMLAFIHHRHPAFSGARRSRDARGGDSAAGRG